MAVLCFVVSFLGLCAAGTRPGDSGAAFLGQQRYEGKQMYVFSEIYAGYSHFLVEQRIKDHATNGPGRRRVPELEDLHDAHV